MHKVAFSDIDGTLFRSSLLIQLVEELVVRGLFPPEARDEYCKERQSWVDRRLEYPEYINAVVDSFRKHLKGVPYGDYLEAGNHVVSLQKDMVYCYTRDLLKDLKADGYTLIAISHSPKSILDPFCAHHGFDKVYGILYELGPQDRFTGNMLEEHLILNKANIVKRVVEKEGLTLEGSVGIGDSEGDIPLLEMVERPVCFNPSKALYTHAKVAGWDVVVERKNMVYEL